MLPNRARINPLVLHLAETVFFDVLPAADQPIVTVLTPRVFLPHSGVIQLLWLELILELG